MKSYVEILLIVVLLKVNRVDFKSGFKGGARVLPKNDNATPLSDEDSGILNKEFSTVKQEIYLSVKVKERRLVHLMMIAIPL